MTRLAILQYPDPRLKTVAAPVENVQASETKTMIHDMLETLEKTEHCGGLAATQLDIKHPQQIFVFYDYDESDSEKRTPMVVINPKIIKTEGTVFEDEGCMSVHPDHIHAKITRPAFTTIEALDAQGNRIELTRGGYLAKLFVHEIDHLEGRVFIDHLKPLKRKMVDAKIKKVIKAKSERLNSGADK